MHMAGVGNVHAHMLFVVCQVLRRPDCVTASK